MPVVVFKYRLTGVGFCEAVFSIGDAQLDVSLGDSPDPLEELMTVAHALARGEELPLQIIWDPEDGGLYRWHITRSRDRLRLQVSYVDAGDLGKRGPRPDVPMRPFDAICTVQDFCSAVADCAAQVIAHYGPDRFIELWFSPFPYELLGALQFSIAQMPTYAAGPSVSK